MNYFGWNVDQWAIVLARYPAEVLDDQPAKAIEAIQTLAIFMKTVGMGKDSFSAIMENIDIMATQSGRKPGEVRRWLRNKDYYLGKSQIMVI